MIQVEGLDPQVNKTYRHDIKMMVGFIAKWIQEFFGGTLQT